MSDFDPYRPAPGAPGAIRPVGPPLLRDNETPRPPAPSGPSSPSGSPGTSGTSGSSGSWGPPGATGIGVRDPLEPRGTTPAPYTAAYDATSQAPGGSGLPGEYVSVAQPLATASDPLAPADGVSGIGRPSSGAPATFWTGMAAPWQGLKYIATHPSVWAMAMVPVAIATTLFTVLSTSGIYLAWTQIQRHFSGGGSFDSLLGALAKIVAIALVLVVSYLAATFVTQPLAGPALQKLVARWERDAGLPARPVTPFLVDMWRGARSAAIGMLSLPLLLILTLVEMAFPAASIVIFPLKVLVAGAFVSWDLLDYPLSARDWRLRDRFDWLRSHKALSLGFGCSLALLFMIPLMQLVMLPVGVVGATWLVRRAEEGDG